MLAPEEIISLQPGDKVRITGLCFDRPPWTIEGTIAAPSKQDGFYKVGGLGTWCAYGPTSTHGKVWLPSYVVFIRPKGKRKMVGYQTGDALTVERM